MLDLATLSDDDLAGAAQLEGDEWLAELFRRYERRMCGCAHHVLRRRRLTTPPRRFAGR